MGIYLPRYYFPTIFHGNGNQVHRDSNQHVERQESGLSYNTAEIGERAQALLIQLLTELLIFL